MQRLDGAWYIFIIIWRIHKWISTLPVKISWLDNQ